MDDRSTEQLQSNIKAKVLATNQLIGCFCILAVAIGYG